jgi:hypothetical protein
MSADDEVLRRCVPSQTQHRNTEPKNATGSATPAQRSSLKAAAFKVLERNRQRNTTATLPEDTRNTRATVKRPYRFVLRDDEGSGIYVTEAGTVEQAWQELANIYGEHRLMVVGLIGS